MYGRFQEANMKIILKLFGTLFGIAAAGMFGNWVGDQMRKRATGEASQHFQFSRGTQEGEETVIAVKPNLTNFVPALLAGAALKPRLVWAFLGGLLASGFLGDQYEESVRKWIDSKRPQE
jgi:hypothetical protein